MTYPCATTPSCGMEHDIDNTWDFEEYHPQLGQHLLDHADRYLDLVAKLRDVEAERIVADAWFETRPLSLSTQAAVHILTALKTYLGLTPQEPQP